MIIRTRRLRIEPLAVDHADFLYWPLQDERLYKFIPADPPESLEKLRERYAYLEPGRSPDSGEAWLNWTLFLHSGHVVGTFQATVPSDGPALIAYTIFVNDWRRGFATEAGAALIQLLFRNFESPSIEALVDTRNMPSIQLLEKLGFGRMATIHKADFFKGASSDEYRFELLRGDAQERESYR